MDTSNALDWVFLLFFCWNCRLSCCCAVSVSGFLHSSPFISKLNCFIEESWCACWRPYRFELNSVFVCSGGENAPWWWLEAADGIRGEQERLHSQRAKEKERGEHQAVNINAYAVNESCSMNRFTLQVKTDLFNLRWVSRPCCCWCLSQFWLFCHRLKRWKSSNSTA